MAMTVILIKVKVLYEIELKKNLQKCWWMNNGFSVINEQKNVQFIQFLLPCEDFMNWATLGCGLLVRRIYTVFSIGQKQYKLISVIG